MTKNLKAQLDKVWAKNADWIRDEIGDMLTDLTNEVTGIKDVDTMNEAFNYLWDKLICKQ